LNNFIAHIKFSPFFLLSLLPLRVLYLISDAGFLVIFYLVRLRRPVTFENLRGSFPEKEMKEIRKIEKKYYRHFCDLFLESVKLLSIDKDQIKKRFEVKNPEILDHYYSKDKSVILYTAHIGNWEWLGSLPLHTRHQLVAFYQAQKNKYFDALMNRLRGRFGCIMVESKRGYKSLVDFADQKIHTLTIIVGDQCPSRNSSKQWVPFLNRETAFLGGADRFVKKLNQVVIFPVIKKVKRGYYQVELRILYDGSPDRSDPDIIKAYSRELESAIISSPEQWLWSHRRWKEFPDEPYPHESEG